MVRGVDAGALAERERRARGADGLGAGVELGLGEVGRGAGQAGVLRGQSAVGLAELGELAAEVGLGLAVAADLLAHVDEEGLGRGRARQGGGDESVDRLARPVPAVVGGDLAELGDEVLDGRAGLGVAELALEVLDPVGRVLIAATVGLGARPRVVELAEGARELPLELADPFGASGGAVDDGRHVVRDGGPGRVAEELRDPVAEGAEVAPALGDQLVAGEGGGQVVHGRLLGGAGARPWAWRGPGSRSPRRLR
ncbi:hypothetical protein D3C72_844650 [compost metagenome]